MRCDHVDCAVAAENGGGKMGRLESLIKTGGVYFSQPSNFNDPFECRAQVFYDPKGANTVRHVNGRTKQFFPNASPADRLRFSAQLRRKYSKPRSEGHENQIIDDRTGLLCLVERPDNLLMWAHYGDSHKGVCLEFDTSEWLFRLAAKIHYSETYPLVDTANQTPEEIMRETLLRKSKEWEYEQEWRIVSMRGMISGWPEVQRLYECMHGSGVHQMPNRLIRRIVFGANASDASITLVKSWVYEAGLSCAFSQCKLVSGRYQLELESV